MFVNLYIMRHGDAQPYVSTDAARQLTQKGIEQVNRNALWLKQCVGQFDLVLVSPYIRARQTQKIISDVLGTPKRLETTADIVPEGCAVNVHEYIDAAIALYQAKSVLVVSHMPLVSYLVEAFTVDKNSPIFPTGGIAHIEYDPQQMIGNFQGLKSP